jgi:hypothetical protein
MPFFKCIFKDLLTNLNVRFGFFSKRESSKPPTYQTKLTSLEKNCDNVRWSLIDYFVCIPLGKLPRDGLVLLYAVACRRLFVACLFVCCYFNFSYTWRYRWDHKKREIKCISSWMNWFRVWWVIVPETTMKAQYHSRQHYTKTVPEQENNNMLKFST